MPGSAAAAFVTSQVGEVKQYISYSCITPGLDCLLVSANHAMTQQVITLKYVYKSMHSSSLERLHSWYIIRISHFIVVMPAVDLIYYSWLGSNVSLHVSIVMQLDVHLLLIAVLLCICLIVEMCEYPLKDSITTKCKTQEYINLYCYRARTKYASAMAVQLGACYVQA